MEKLTVFTPTFNRAFILEKVYQSLLKQTRKDFKWLIVDDGSKDNTSDLVQRWKEENKIAINYIWQENKGMVAAHNTAHYNIDTELNVCIDSDDFMTDNAVEAILKHWESIGNKENLMGLVGLDVYKNGKVIGNEFPVGVQESTFSELLYIHKIKGDKKYVLRSDLVKSKLPYPRIENEKFPAPSYIYLLLEDRYKFSLLNTALCVVEYLPDGNSMNKIKQYKNNPKSYAIYRIAKMKKALSYKETFKEAIHYVSSSIIAKNRNFIRESPFKLTTVLAIPFGWLLSLYILNTKTTQINKKLNKK
ncbi:glycosyltransferase family 2 protein [Sphingobacterium kitahiroshimense]|uniref:glycosyltransferase family 2 protein n=1 Tax=Sphingobacterium kitahiroshimense TaxID=470446 RepID=UPI00320B0506